MTDWSYGPDPRAKPSGAFVVPALLAVIIVALLATGVAGVAVHHRSSSTATTVAGGQRLIDLGDHLSLAVPAGWEAPLLNAGALSAEIQNLKSANPQMAAVADIALAALQKIQFGLYAVDTVTRTSLFVYGADVPGIVSVDEISPADVVAHIRSAGATNIEVTRVHLPIGDAGRVSDQLSVGSVTVSELLDYFVLDHRVVGIVLASRGTQPLTGLLHQIEGTLARA